MMEIVFDDVVCKPLQLLIFLQSGFFCPSFLKHTVDVNNPHTLLNEVDYGIIQVPDIGRSQCHLGITLRAIVFRVMIQSHHVDVIASLSIGLDSTGIMKLLVPINRDVERDVVMVFPKEVLDLIIKILHTIGTDTETVEVEPWMVHGVALLQEVLIDPSNQSGFQERFTADKLNDDRRGVVMVDVAVLIVKQVVNEQFSCVERHPCRTFVTLVAIGTVVYKRTICDICMALCLEIIHFPLEQLFA